MGSAGAGRAGASTERPTGCGDFGSPGGPKSPHRGRNRGVRLLEALRWPKLTRIASSNRHVRRLEVLSSPNSPHRGLEPVVW